MPGERIDLPSAIAAFTINAACINIIDDITGSAEVGKLADLVILDCKLFELDQAGISDTQVLVTLMDGKSSTASCPGQEFELVADGHHHVCVRRVSPHHVRATVLRIRGQTGKQ